MQMTNHAANNHRLHYIILSFFIVIALIAVGLYVFRLLSFGSSMAHMDMAAASGDTDGKIIPYQHCNSLGPTHTITIEHNAFVPDTLTVKRCDKVEFIDKDHALYLPRFGDHPNDITYTGFPQKVLGYNQSEIFIAHTIGTYNFHDHIKDQIEGVLIVQ